MDDTLELFQPLCTGSVRLESRTALIEPLVAQLKDSRDPRQTTHSLPSLLRASMPMFAQGRGDQSDAARLRAQGHKRLERITLGIDGLPLHGEQPGSVYNGHVRKRIHYPLIASCPETGNLLAGLQRDGNAGPAQKAATWIPRIVQTARSHLAPEGQVRLDARFTHGATLAALNAAEIPFVGR